MKKQLSIMIALAVMAIGLITSCKKDSIPNNNEQNNEQIHFGDTTGMIVTPYNTVMEYDESWIPILLDLDGNGTDDIRIETYYDGPLAIGQFQELTLHCINAQIHGQTVEKESYSHRDTTITNNDGWTHIVSNYTYSTCGKIDENDPTSTSDVFEITAFDFNEHLNLDDNFQLQKLPTSYSRCPRECQSRHREPRFRRNSSF